jgi:polysaccharide biosynthesis/export protein
MAMLAGLLAAMLPIAGCEMHTFLDQSAVQRLETTPCILPILDRLDIIDDQPLEPPGLTQVRPEDLVATAQEYVLGTGDSVAVTVPELQEQGKDYAQARKIDDLGFIRLPDIGKIKAEGLTPSQLEDTIAQIIKAKGKLNDPQVSVYVQDARANLFSVLGEPATSGTNIGTYQILGKDFRLLDAIALARGVNGSIKKLYVIRQVSLSSPSTTGAGTVVPDQPPKGGTRPEDLIKDLLPGLDPVPPTGGGASDKGQPPTGIDAGLDDGGKAAKWVNVNGKWVKVDAGDSGAAPVATTQPAMATRVIEIPLDKLQDGDTRYNIVIRTGDIIRVPPAVTGNVYIMGHISRPGTYALPGDRDLTIKQLIAAAGNLDNLAVPERTDLIRRMGKDQEDRKSVV